MPNNNVAILSIMSKFDEKSAREAAKRADKVYEEALSDIGNVNFDKKLIENFDKAMNLLKNKFKKVNLSSYTNSLLDSIFSDKDIKEKSKDIESFISKIEMLKKASSGQDINAFNTFSAKQIDALISRTEKLAEKQEEINEKTREYNREATKIAKANRSISTIDKNYGNQDYSKTLESLKESLGTEKEFTAEQNQSIENLAKMVNLYQVMEKSEPQKGTAEAIRYSKDLLAVTQKIKEERDKIDAFSKKGASTYITNNGLSSVDKVSDYTVSKSKEDFVKASLSNLKSQEAKLQSELTTYISDSVQKNLAKVSKEVDAVVDKAEKRVENLQNKIESLQTKSTKTDSDNSIIGGIVSNSDIKSLEEIEDRLYAISDLDAEGEATKQQLKEYIQLYKQYEQLIANDSTVKFDPGLKEEYDFIVESDSKLKKYADTLDETISKQKELNAVKSNENEVFVDAQTEQLVKQEEQIKETIQAEKQLQDTQEKVSSNTKISVDAEQAIADINKIKESLDSIPEEKNIKITISDSDYTNTPLLSDAEGNTITAFRGVVGAWSGLINQDGIGFFTDKLKLAADYADSLAESGKVYQANLSFKNPLEVEGNGAKWDEIDFNGVKKTTDEIVELAKQLGHDGVIFKNIRDGFTDTDEDISNVMVALNAAQIKNEQVIGTVKAGTGEMVDVASKIDNATDTATNSTVESQNKIQEELKETQKVAEQTSESLSKVNSSNTSFTQEINELVEQYNKSKSYFKDESLLYNIMVGKDGGVKTRTEFVSEINSMLKEAQQKISDVYNSGKQLTEEEIVNNYYGEALKRLRAAKSFGIVDLKDITAPYGNDQTYLKQILDTFTNTNLWSKQLDEMNDDSWSFISNLIEQQERLNALQKNGGQDYIEILEKTKTLSKEINDITINNSEAGTVDKHTLNISKEEAMKKANALEAESQKIDDIISSLRSLDTEENKYYLESFGYIKNKIEALEELQSKIDKDVFAYKNFQKIQRQDQVDIFSKSTDKTLNKTVPKELERYWEQLEDSILDGSITGQEAIEKFNQKAQELGKTFDEVQKKWIDIVQSSVDKSNISSENSIVESQNKIQEELKETQKQAEQTQEALIEVYRGVQVKGTNGVTNRQYNDSIWSDAAVTFASSSPDVAALYQIIRDQFSEQEIKLGDGEILKEVISLQNALSLDNGGKTFEEITYWGDATDEAGKKAKSTYESLLQILKELQDTYGVLITENAQLYEDNWGNSKYSFSQNGEGFGFSNAKELAEGLSEEKALIPNFVELIQRYMDAKMSLDSQLEANPMFGKHHIEDFAKMAQQAGYSVVEIKNVIDTFDQLPQDLATDYIIIDPSAIKSVEQYTGALSELTQERLRLAEQGKETNITEISKTPIEDVFQGDGNSNTSFSSNLDEIEKEKSALLELKNTVSLITEEIDRKTQAFYNEKSAVDLIIPEEIATLESLERELKIIIESIEQISKIPINIDFNLENLDENSASVISKLKDSLSGFNGSSLTNISSILEGFKISKTNVENLQKLANAILTLKSNLNNVGNSGQQFLSDIKELVAQSDGLKDLATVLKSSQKQIDNAKKTTNTNVDSKNTEENTNAWKELTYSIQRYSEVSKRISSGKALEGDIKEASRLENKISQLQKLDILSPTQIEKSEQMLTKLYDSLDDIEKKSKETTLESLNSSIDKYRNDYNSRSSKPFIDNQSDQYKKLLANYETSIKELEAYRDKIRNNPLVSKEDLNQIDELTKKVKKSATAFNSLTASQKGSTPLSRGKAIEWANDLLEQNSKWSKKAKIEVQGWINKLATADPSNIEEIRNRILEIVRAEREAGNAGKTWLDIFSTKKLHSFLGQAASMFSFYDLVNVGREGFQTIRELDTALTEMKKVSDETTQSLKNYQSTTFDVGDAVGATAKTIQESTADWMRLGESINEAAESAKASNILLNVSEFESIDEATESLVAMSQAYSELGKMDIIDVLNNIGNNYSIATDGLATALQKSASALKTANNDLNSAVALATAGNAVVQDPDSVGAGIRTISLRLVGTEAAKQELESIGEETDDVITTTSKLRDTILSATAAATNDGKGFDIFDSNGNYKSTYEIMQGLADLYDDIVAKDKELGTNNLNLLLETIAGKNRSNIAASILQNGEMLRSVYQDAQNSSGSAQKELDSYLDSIDGRMTQLENRAQEFWYKVIDSDTIKNGITLLTDLLELGTDIVDTFGVLPTIIAGVGAGLAAKNIGRPKKFGLYKYADINMCSLGY